MRVVRYLEEARAEFLHEIDYFSKTSPLLAERFDLAVQTAEAQAAEFADMGTPYKHGTRRVLLPSRFKFSLVYMTGGGAIQAEAWLLEGARCRLKASRSNQCLRSLGGFKPEVQQAGY